MRPAPAFPAAVDHDHCCSGKPFVGQLQPWLPKEQTRPKTFPVGASIPSALPLNCATTLASIPALAKALLVCMRRQPELAREWAHALKNLCQHCTSELAEQILLSGMLDLLLKTLASPLTGVTNPAAAKAEIADALKFCCQEPQFGERISAVLQKSSIWSQYKDQRHDLFLPTLTQTQAITGGPSGGTSSIAGYLTEGMFEPPPARIAPPPQIRAPAADSQQRNNDLGPLGGPL